jgi:hypothetical protein
VTPVPRIPVLVEELGPFSSKKKWTKLRVQPVALLVEFHLQFIGGIPRLILGGPNKVDGTCPLRPQGMKRESPNKKKIHPYSI